MKNLGKKARLLLINPWVYDFTAYDFWSKPLGLLYLASVLKEAGFEIDYLDCMDRYEPKLLKIQNRILPESNQDGTGPFYKVNISKPGVLKHIPRNYSRYGITEEIFHEKLKEIVKPNAILVTSIMTYWYPGVFRVIELIRKRFPDCPIILGGIYATLCYQHAMDFSGADFVIKHFQLGQLLKLFHNVFHIHVKTNLLEQHFSVLQNIDSYPYPAWDLYQHLDYVCLITSRGCPYRCSYCASNLVQPSFEFRSPLKVFKEILYWKEVKHINRFVFYDDALLANAGLYFIPLMKALKKRNLKLSFYTPNALHANMITENIARLMLENGFKKIWLGLETADCELQKNTGGKIDNAGFRKSIEILLKEGFRPEQIRTYVLIGLPGQSFKSILDTIYFVLDTGVKPYLAKFSPIPGTKIWKRVLKEYGWMEPVDPLWHNDALIPYHSSSINTQQYHQLKKIIQNMK